MRVFIACVESVVFVLAPALIFAYCVFRSSSSSRAGRAEVGLHRARRQLELEQHRFEVRRDAERVRREIDNELR
jgi:hypothetical protein